jgi:hypothetical protein
VAGRCARLGALCALIVLFEIVGLKSPVAAQARVAAQEFVYLPTAENIAVVEATIEPKMGLPTEDGRSLLHSDRVIHQAIPCIRFVSCGHHFFNWGILGQYKDQRIRRGRGSNKNASAYFLDDAGSFPVISETVFDARRRPPHGCYLAFFGGQQDNLKIVVLNNDKETSAFSSENGVGGVFGGIGGYFVTLKRRAVEIQSRQVNMAKSALKRTSSQSVGLSYHSLLYCPSVSFCLLVGLKIPGYQLCFSDLAGCL